ncbi:MAG: NAD(P)-dependent oxidoreductase [Bacteroidota bacterium]
MKSPIQKVLVTGSSGYLGSTLVSLLKDTYDVTGIDISHSPTTHNLVDLTNKQAVEDACRGQHAIIHTAALHAPHVQIHSKEAFIDTNIKGTLYLLEAAQEHGIRRFVYSSSTSVYGKSLVNPYQAVWVTEELAPRGRDIYDITKLAAEGLCEDLFDASGLVTVSLRVSRFWKEPLPDKLWYRLYRGLDVIDAAKAHEQALQFPTNQYEVFNISGETPFLPDEVETLLHDPTHLLQQKAEELLPFFEEMGWEVPKQIDRVYAIEKAKKLLWYKPTHSYLSLIDEIRRENNQ